MIVLQGHYGRFKSAQEWQVLYKLYHSFPSTDFPLHKENGSRKLLLTKHSFLGTRNLCPSRHWAGQNSPRTLPPHQPSGPNPKRKRGSTGKRPWPHSSADSPALLVASCSRLPSAAACRSAWPRRPASAREKHMACLALTSSGWGCPGTVYVDLNLLLLALLLTSSAHPLFWIGLVATIVAITGIALYQ